MFNFIGRLSAAIPILWLLACHPAQAGSGLALLATMGGTNHVPAAIFKSSAQSRFDIPLEKECMAFALYHEARGEPHSGQLAVAATILNRARSRAYPETICGVVYQNAARMNACQFSFACDGLSDTPRSQPTYAAVKSIAATVIADYRPSNAVPISGPHVSQIEYTHYHRHDVSPEWSKKLQLLGRIGDHVFFRSKRVVRRYASTL